MLDKDGLAALLNAWAATMAEQKTYLTDLDQAIGDGDHGLNMDRGFRAVAEKVAARPDADLGNMLKQTGMVLLSTVGGAAGPLYGSAFMKAGQVLAGKQNLTLADLTVGLEAGLQAIKQRGKAEAGEKTMIDALEPALQALQALQVHQAEQGAPATACAALTAAATAALKGAEFTRTIRATKGRASYLGERSIGHQDPGATSVYLLLETLRQQICSGMAAEEAGKAG